MPALPNATAGQPVNLTLFSHQTEYDRRPFKLFLSQISSPESAWLNSPLCTLANTTTTYRFVRGATSATITLTLPADIGPANSTYQIVHGQLLRDNGSWDMFDVSFDAPPTFNISNANGTASELTSNLGWYARHNWISCDAVGCVRGCMARIGRTISEYPELYSCMTQCEGANFPDFEVLQRSQTRDVECRKQPVEEAVSVFSTTCCWSTSSAALDTTVTLGEAVSTGSMTTTSDRAAYTTASTAASTTAPATNAGVGAKRELPSMLEAFVLCCAFVL